MQTMEAPAQSAANVGPLTRDDYFHCFLADQPSYLVPARLVNEKAVPPASALIVNPNSWFSWRDGIPGLIADCCPLPEMFLAHTGLIWTYNRATGIRTPFWAGPWLQERTAGLWPGDPAPPDLPDGLRDLLYSAGILVPSDEDSRQLQEFADYSADIAGKFAENGYAPIGQWASPYHLGALRRYYRRLVRTGRMKLGDSGCSRRYIAHNDSVAGLFHRQLARQVSAFAGVPVK